jgi:hypothetical protein
MDTNNIVDFWTATPRLLPKCIAHCNYGKYIEANNRRNHGHKGKRIYGKPK